MLSLHSIVIAVMLLFVVGIVCWLGVWVINYLGAPEPYRKIATVIIVVLAVLFALLILVNVVGERVLTP